MTGQSELWRDEARIVQLAVNPAAGRHDRAKVDALARALERRGATVIRTECGPHRAFELDARAGQVCAIGGDGTARHVAVAASRSERPVGISLYPAGTINLLHRERAGALDPDLRAAALLAGGAGRNHYAASINDSLFLACASVGPDSAAVAAVSPRLKARVGRLAYAAAFLRVLLTWPRRPIALRSNGRTIACEAFYVAKGRFFAGPWSFAPEASVGDPLLHVVALAKLTRRRYARFLWAMLMHRPIDRVPGVICFTCTELTADCAEPFAIQADGDIAARLPARIAVKEEPLVFI